MSSSRAIVLHGRAIPAALSEFTQSINFSHSGSFITGTVRGYSSPIILEGNLPRANTRHSFAITSPHSDLAIRIVSNFEYVAELSSGSEVSHIGLQALLRWALLRLRQDSSYIFLEASSQPVISIVSVLKSA